MNKTPCDEFADRIVDYVDGELPEDEARHVAEHLNDCPSCRQIAHDLQRSLGLARVLWEDNLGDTKAVATRCRRWVPHVAAVAAGLLLAAGILLISVAPRGSRNQVLTAEQVERQVQRAGLAAQLLAATRIVAQCEGTESIVERQYRYILSEYADTPAAQSIKTSYNLNVGGTPDE
ncbi:MAG: zf-HC2 domain-containing protein [Planctomycetes bacterium]|jgi:anti-sigma factor RsiW|nr:zf-HC2 domain-containing protein [Planctomycetota bacterium]